MKSANAFGIFRITTMWKKPTNKQANEERKKKRKSKTKKRTDKKMPTQKLI